MASAKRFDSTAFAVCLVVLTLAVHGRSVTFGFINLDDSVCIREPHVRAGLSFDGIRWATTSFYFSNWMPLTWLSYMLDWSWYHGDSFGFHTTNLFLHTASAVLLFAALQAATQESMRSFCAAALFAVHPLNVEPVAWIAERKGLLAVFFGMWSLLAYVEYAKLGGTHRWLASIAFFACSLASKQSLVAFPFVLWLLDRWPLRRTPRFREKGPFLVLSLFACIVAVIAQGDAIRPLHVVTWANRVTMPISNVGLQLWHVVWPANLAVIYPFPEGIELEKITWCALAIGGVTLVAIQQWLKRPFIGVGWGWFCLLFAPVAGFMPVGMQPTADRYTYFPAIGLWIIVAWLPNRKILAFLAAPALVTLACVSAIQSDYWSSSLKLFRHAVAVTQNNPEAATQLRRTIIFDPQK